MKLSKNIIEDFSKYLPIFVCLMLLLGCHKKQDNIAHNEPLSVNVIIAKNEERQSIIISNTILQGIKRATIVSQTRDEVISVNAELGKKVKQGEILLLYESSVQQANLQQTTGAVEEAKLNYTANEILFEQNKISRAEFVKSQNNLFAAQTALANAQKLLNRTNITAPFTGIITMKNDMINIGNSIPLDSALFTIVDISKVKAKILLDEKEIGNVKVGTKVNVKVEAVNREYSGIITAVSVGIDNQTGKFIAETEFDNSDLAVKDGMSGVASIYTGESKTDIYVPSSAVREDGFLFLVRDGLARSVHISRISENDTIIISDIDKISDGDAVNCLFTDD